MFLKKVSILNSVETNENRYPFTIPTIKNLSELELTSSVTFLVGEMEQENRPY